MAEPIISIDQIKQQAREAAGKYTNINDACPYPFGTEAARVFGEEFHWVRSVLDQKAQAAH